MSHPMYDNVSIGKGTKIWHFSHVLGHCSIGENCSFGQNVVIGPNVEVGIMSKYRTMSVFMRA